MTHLHVRSFLHPPTSTYSYVVWESSSNEAVVIDSVMHYDPASGTTETWYADQIVSFLRANRLKLVWLLETHAHADHLSAAAYLKEVLGGSVGIGSGICRVQRHFREVYNLERKLPDGALFDHLFEDEERFSIGSVEARVIATPGHTPDHVTYLIGQNAFVGDTLFMPDGGTARCDFPGGDASVLYRSIQKLFRLPDSTRIFVLHDYRPNGRDYECEADVEDQRRHNIHVGAGRSEAEFVTLRQERDTMLELPKLIIPAVQVNMCAGRFPLAEDNGVRYIKIPLNCSDRFTSNPVRRGSVKS